MLVYRIENANKVGPYQSQTSDTFLAQNLSSMAESHMGSHHPTPFEDCGRYIRAYEYCAFESLDKLSYWFAGYAAILTECGFSIVTYEVPETEITFGSFQLLVADLAYFPLVSRQVPIEVFQ